MINKLQPINQARGRLTTRVSHTDKQSVTYGNRSIAGTKGYIKLVKRQIDIKVAVNADIATFKCTFFKH